MSCNNVRVYNYMYNYDVDLKNICIPQVKQLIAIVRQLMK